MPTLDSPPPGYVATPVIYPEASKDPECRRLLCRWAVKPWQTDLALVVADRLEEMGFPFAAACVRHTNTVPVCHDAAMCSCSIVWVEGDRISKRLPRRMISRRLRAWRTWLVRTFGDFYTETHDPS